MARRLSIKWPWLPPRRRIGMALDTNGTSLHCLCAQFDSAGMHILQAYDWDITSTSPAPWQALKKPDIILGLDHPEVQQWCITADALLSEEDFDATLQLEVQQKLGNTGTYFDYHRDGDTTTLYACTPETLTQRLTLLQQWRWQPRCITLNTLALQEWFTRRIALSTGTALLYGRNDHLLLIALHTQQPIIQSLPYDSTQTLAPALQTLLDVTALQHPSWTVNTLYLAGNVEFDHFSESPLRVCCATELLAPHDNALTSQHILAFALLEKMYYDAA